MAENQKWFLIGLLSGVGVTCNVISLVYNLQ